MSNDEYQHQSFDSGIKYSADGKLIMISDSKFVGSISAELFHQAMVEEAKKPFTSAFDEGINNGGISAPNWIYTSKGWTLK